ncbi:signal transduction histidine kinase [Dyadobacter jejuensis]|uniref:histidine kinase n=1 Tax=Dyadobacter jejuensis TaxID=1082580 RepID=A0A316AJ68_9BACT|nr:HAMP domain-containing sensor histidine kinase [Dyadobacter jejuensis]PWJ56920.1 signal transduction histidine kinase [Dyadobacter jejuensis]
MKIFLHLLVFGLLCSPSSIAAVDTQVYSDQYIVKNYTDEDGLPQNSVNRVVYDANGFIWLATENGVVRYDGQSFYTFNNNNTHMPNTRAAAFLPDFGGQGSRMFVFFHNNPLMRIENIIVRPDSIYMAECLRRIPGLFNFDHTHQVATGLPSMMRKGGQLKIKNYLIFVPRRQGTFFRVQHERITYYENWKIEWSRKVPFKANLDDYFYSNGYLLTLEPDGRLVQYTADSSQDLSIKGSLSLDSDFRESPKDSRLYWNSITSQGFIKVKDRLYLLEYIEDGYCHSKLIFEGFDFERNRIYSICYDKRQERLYLGSNIRGLFIVDKRVFQSVLFEEKGYESVHYALTPLDSHRVLLASGKVITVAESKHHLKTLGRLPFIEWDPEMDLYSIFVSKNGEIWHKALECLHRYSLSKGKMLNNWYFGQPVNTIYEGADGRVWVGLAREGVYVIDPKKPFAQPQPFSLGKLPWVNYFLEDGKGTLFVGTKNGLYAMDVHTGGYELIAGTEKLLVRSLHMFGKNTPVEGLLIMTYTDGIYYYNGNRLLKLPLDGHGYLSASHCAVEDQRGYIWITTNTGLFQFAKKDIASYLSRRIQGESNPNRPFYLYYSRKEGLATNEFNGGCQPCAATLQNGTFFFPSMKGLLHFQANTVMAKNVPSGSLYLDRVSVNSVVRLNDQDKIILPLDSTRVNVHVATPYFGNGNNIRISYALIPSAIAQQEPDWIYLPEGETMIRFSSIPSGDHTLIVRKSNGFGENNFLYRAIDFVVPLHWYETWWFRLITLLFCCLMVLLIIWLRTRYLKSLNKRLEDQVVKVTKDLSDTLKALQSSESELKHRIYMQTRLVASLSHDIRTPMRYQASGAERVGRLIDSHKLVEAQELLSTIVGSSKHMKRQLDNMVLFIRSQSYEEMVIERVKLRDIAEEVVLMYAHTAQQLGNSIKNELDPGLFANTSRILLVVILQNLVDNANKHNQGTIIRIFSEETQGQLMVTVADNGPGLPLDLLNWLNSAQTIDSESQNSMDQKRGLGLMIVVEMCKLLSITIQAKNDNGALIGLLFAPIKKTSL